MSHTLRDVLVGVVLTPGGLVSVIIVGYYAVVGVRRLAREWFA
jgi:hypothetical protein